MLDSYSCYTSMAETSYSLLEQLHIALTVSAHHIHLPHARRRYHIAAYDPSSANLPVAVIVNLWHGLRLLPSDCFDLGGFSLSVEWVRPGCRLPLAAVSFFITCCIRSSVRQYVQDSFSFGTIPTCLPDWEHVSACGSTYIYSQTAKIDRDAASSHAPCLRNHFWEADYSLNFALALGELHKRNSHQ
jgi:hypothetical protein